MRIFSKIEKYQRNLIYDPNRQILKTGFPNGLFNDKALFQHFDQKIQTG